MQVGKLRSAMDVVTAISNTVSLTPLYRSVQLGPQYIRAVSEFGNVEIMEGVTGLTDTVYVETTAFNTVISSLNRSSEITVELNGTSLAWKAGEARGHWQTVQQEHKIPAIDHTHYPWKPTKEFPEALLIAASACMSSAVSMGLYGVELSFEEGKLKMISSNSIALAYTEIDAGEINDPNLKKLTLRPPVPAILAKLFAVSKEVFMDVQQDGLHFRSEYLAAHLPVATDLAHNLRAILAKFPSSEYIAGVNTTALKTFLSRARALADKKQTVQIGLKVTGGKMVLEHRGLTSSSEEYFLAEGLETTASFDSVSMPLDMLLTPLEHVDGVILDYMTQKTLVLVGADYGFSYIVGGK